MIFDTRNEFADAVSVAAAAGTALIGDVVDMTETSNRPGDGEPVYLVIQTATEIITGGVAGTIQFKLSSDAQAAIATDGSATDHIITASYVTHDAGNNSDELNAGGVIYAGALPMDDYERYLGVLAVIGTTTVTAGAINAFLTRDVSRYKSYPNAI